MEKKKCRTCEELLECSSFRESKRTKDGFALDCNECISKMDRGHNHKYGEFKPGRKLDNGEYMKKRGRKKGEVTVTAAALDIEVGTVVNYLTFGKSEIVNKENKLAGVKPNTPLTVIQATREFGIHPNTFYNHMSKYPEIKKRYETMKNNMREFLKDTAESNMQEIISHGDLSDKERFDASFKVVQSTMKEYNPKVEIEKKEVKVNLDRKSEDLKADLAILLGLNG